MICYATKDDLGEIIELFNKCFPNEEQFAELFFEKFYKYQDTLVYKKDDKIVGMLQMIPYKTSFGHATYIYGACTDEQFRKQGIMDSLLEKSFEISRERGHLHSFLIPGEPWLFKFYEKYGYEPKLLISSDLYVTRGNVTPIETIEIKSDNALIVKNIYDNTRKNGFFIDRSIEDFANQFELFNCLLFKDNGKDIGYAFYYIGKNKFGKDQIVIEEIISSNLEQALYTACKYFKIGSVLYKTIGNNRKLGCIKSISNKKAPYGYINLMFN